MLLKSTSVKYSNNLKIFIRLVQQYYTGDITLGKITSNIHKCYLKCIYTLIFKNNIKNHETVKNLQDCYYSNDENIT